MEQIPTNKSQFIIKQMDCAAEENLVRMKLDGFASIQHLDFDLAERSLIVYHTGGIDSIEQAIDDLNLNSRLVNTEETAEKIHFDTKTQQNVLWAVLIINFTFFAIESLFGYFSGSLGLVADSLDMLADAIVYGLSLFAIGASIQRKRSVTKISGYFQLSLAGIGLFEVLRRFLGQGAAPDFITMIIVSFLALIANAICLYLLQRSKSNEMHMQATMIFTSNDIIINLSVIVAGLLVNWLNSGLPDLIIGAIVFIIVARGSFRILKLAE